MTKGHTQGRVKKHTDKKSNEYCNNGLKSSQ